MRIQVFIPAIALLSMLATGCSGVSQTVQTNIKTAETSAKHYEQVTKDMQEPPPAMSRSPYQWLGNRVVPRAKPKPKVLSVHVGFEDSEKVTLQHIAQRVTQVTGVPVSLSPDLFQTPTASTSTSSTATSVSSVATPGLGSAATSVASSSETQIPVADVKFRIPFEGTLEEFLNVIAARLNIAWEYTDGQIFFHRFVTKVFYVEALPGSTKVSAGSGQSGTSSTGSDTTGSVTGTSSVVNDSSSTSTSSSSNTMQVGMSADVNLWKSIVAGVQAMLSSDGRVSISESTGSIVVTDTPSVVDSVAEYITQENRLLTRQIAFEFTLLTVSLTDTEDAGVDINALFNNGHISLGAASQALSFDGNSLNLTVVDPNSKFNNTQALIKAISSVAHLRGARRNFGLTLSNQPLSEEVTETHGYLASVTTSSVKDTGTTETSLEPGSQTTGFKFNLLGRALRDDRILLQLGVSLSTPLPFDVESSGNQTIRVPNRQDQDSVQRFKVRSGQMIVLSGLTTEQDSHDQQGVGKPDHWWAGGSRTDSHERNQLIMLIRPVLLDDRMAEGGIAQSGDRE